METKQVVILIVEHFSYFLTGYPAKEHSVQTLAVALFKFYCTFGVFDYLVHDPGSAMMSAVISQLNTSLGVAEKVSLVGRHESCDIEGINSQYLRHLRTLTSDERLQDS